MKNKKIIKIFLIIILILQIAYINPVFATRKAEFDIKSDIKIQNNERKNSEKNYTQAYKDWLKLSDTDKKKSGIIPRKYEVSLDGIYEDTIIIKEKPSIFNLFGLLSKEKVASVYADEIPEEFDLRDEIDILIENQGFAGLCWAFAGLTSLETNLAINGYGDYDFSEKHMDYLTSYSFGGDRVLGGGGNFAYFLDYVAKNDGPVLEETIPYNKIYTSDQYEYLDSLESQAYVIQKIDFPSIDKSITNYSQEELELFRDKVKKHIMDNGSVYVGILGNDIKTSLNGDYTLYNTSTNEDHAVSVIGWDDNYPKENFTDQNGRMPKNDGAYIAVNSWGDTQTYIYISYEDYTVEREMSGIVSATTEIDELGVMEVTFKDNNLYNCIKEIYSKAVISSNEQTKTINLLGYLKTLPINLDISRQNISDLSGVEKFKLDILFAHTNNISDIKVLQNLKDLYVLDLRNNNISDLSIISYLTNLRYLYMGYNDISDISALENLTNLVSLDLANSKISDIKPLEKLTNLMELYIENNNILDISPISNLINLQILDMENNKISNVNALEHLKNLYALNFGYNQVTDITGLSKLINLENLKMSGNKIQNISVLENLTQLVEIWAIGNKISEMGSLSNLTNLKILSISYNNIADVSELVKLTNLEYLSLISNNIDKEITLSEDKIVTVMLPNIIKEAQKAGSIIYSEEGLEFENCKLSADKNSVEIDTSKYSNASVKIKSGQAQSTSFNIKVTGAITGIAIKQLPKTTYTKCENIDLTGGIITVNYSDGKTKEISMNNGDVVLTGYDKETLGNQTITIEYAGYKTTFVVEVVEFASEEIKSDKFKIIEEGDNSIIRDIMPNTNLEELKNGIQTNTIFEILDLNNEAVSDTIVIGTGYKIRMSSGKTYTLIVKGDTNGNGEISLGEVVQAAKVAIGLTTQDDEIKFKAMDVSGNGKINVSDVATVARLRIN